MQKDLIMLGFIFGLNARLGRLQYFLITIGVAVLMTGICFVIARQTPQSTANGVPLSIDSIKGPALVVGIIFMAITLTLQSMRIRDIGWDPVCVIPGWVAILIIDMMVAKKFPLVARVRASRHRRQCHRQPCAVAGVAVLAERR
jgi:uncharacterized membrane protein YhaH (DUF805 family)